MLHLHQKLPKPLSFSNLFFGLNVEATLLCYQSANLDVATITFFFMDGLSMRFDAKKLKQEKELAQGKGEEGENSGNSVLELIVHAFMGVYTLFQ